MTTRAARSRRKVGNVLRIELAQDQHAYAWTLPEPLVAFFDIQELGRNTALAIEELVRSPIAFRIFVMNSALTRGPWTVVGFSPPPASVLEPPWFFKQDILTGALTKTLTGEEEISIELSEAEQLECAAVWEAEHVEDRLRDHFAGRPNKWVERMRPDPHLVPR